MVKDSRDAELNKIISEVDNEVPSPSQRAAVVWNHLKQTAPDLTEWDLVCFATEYLSAQALIYEWLQVPVKQVSRLVFMAHYLNKSLINDATGIDKQGRTGESESRDSIEGSDTSREPQSDST